MNKILRKIILIAISVSILGFAFYWYSYRPSHIVQACSITSKEQAIERYDSSGEYEKEDRDQYYEWCLQEKGLVK